MILFKILIELMLAAFIIRILEIIPARRKAIKYEKKNDNLFNDDDEEDYEDNYDYEDDEEDGAWNHKYFDAEDYQYYIFENWQKRIPLYIIILLGSVFTINSLGSAQELYDLVIDNCALFMITASSFSFAAFFISRIMTVNNYKTYVIVVFTFLWLGLYSAIMIVIKIIDPYLF